MDHDPDTPIGRDLRNRDEKTLKKRIAVLSVNSYDMGWLWVFDGMCFQAGLTGYLR
jgi:hypothetical protein